MMNARKNAELRSGRILLPRVIQVDFQDAPGEGLLQTVESRREVEKTGTADAERARTHVPSRRIAHQLVSNAPHNTRYRYLRPIFLLILNMGPFTTFTVVVYSSSVVCDGYNGRSR